MVFTLEEDTFIVIAYFRSGIQDNMGSWIYSTETCYEQYMAMHPDNAVPFNTFAQHQQRVVDRFIDSGSVCQRKSSGRPKILTPEIGEDVRQRMLQSPNKSLRRLSQQTGICYTKNIFCFK